jgi:ABC-type nitrate/sulfonate/bicarbonate transport system permease component
MNRQFGSASAFAVILAIWLFLSYGLQVPAGLLPTPTDVVQQAQELGLDLVKHLSMTAFRAVIGMATGVGLGIFFCLSAYLVKAESFAESFCQNLRAVPPVAVIPFFLLWFGFAETGKTLILALGLGLNIAVSVFEIMDHLSFNDRAMIKSFGLSRITLLKFFWLPRLGEELLPTVRFSISACFGLVIVAEMLGSQSGLGYLIQTSRSTFSLDVIMLSCILLGCLTMMFDWAIVKTWRSAVFWRQL